MIDRILRYFKRFDHPVSTKSLGLFRILYGFYVLGICYQLYADWPFFFDHIQPFSVSYFPARLSLFLWAIAAVLIITGTFARWAAVANYVMAILMTSFFANANLSSFNDDLLRMGGFLLIILPASRSFGTTALINRLRYRNPPQHTSYLYVLLALCLSLGFLYFASAITKLFSPMWQKGIGIWVPSILPSYHWFPFHYFVDERWLMFGLNYFVVAWELAFIFLLFHRRWHPFLAIVGIGFHLGIALQFPFTYISLGPIMYYVLLLPDTFWERLKRLRRRVSQPIYYDPLQPKQEKAIAMLQGFSVFYQFEYKPTNGSAFVFNNQQGFKAFATCCKYTLVLYPLGISLSSATLRNIAEAIALEALPAPSQSFVLPAYLHQMRRLAFFYGCFALAGVQGLTLLYHTYTVLKGDTEKKMTYLKRRISIQDFSTKPSNLARTFFGINSRGVFLDHAFTGVKAVFSLALVDSTGNEKWLPIFTKEGYVTGKNKNLGWHKLSFRYFALTHDIPDTNGLKKYTWYWCGKNHLAPNNLIFRVYRRKYPIPERYEHGYLQKMLALPWDTIGEIHWRDSVFSYHPNAVKGVDKN